MECRTLLAVEHLTTDEAGGATLKITHDNGHRHTTYDTETQPTRRGSKKLQQVCIKKEILNMGCVYTKHNDNILSDAPFRAPANRAVAKNLTIPLQPIRKTMHRMFWAPDELAGSTTTRLQQLKLENPGILTYTCQMSYWQHTASSTKPDQKMNWQNHQQLLNQ